MSTRKQHSPITDPSASSLRSAQAYGAVVHVSRSYLAHTRLRQAQLPSAYRPNPSRRKRSTDILKGPSRRRSLLVHRGVLIWTPQENKKALTPFRRTGSRRYSWAARRRATRRLVDQGGNRHAVSQYAGAAVAEIIKGRLLGIDRAVDAGRHRRRLGADVSRVSHHHHPFPPPHRPIQIPILIRLTLFNLSR